MKAEDVRENACGVCPAGSGAVMEYEFPVHFSELITCLSRAIDLVSPIVAHHHESVGCIALDLARKLDLPQRNVRNLAIAAALHDAGGLSLSTRKDTMRFEMKDPHEHAHLGYLLLKTFGPFAEAAEIVRFHHVRWEYGAGSEFLGKRVPMESHLLHLADRVAVLLKTETAMRGREESISGRVKGQSGAMFVPIQVAAFLEAAEQVYSRQNGVSSAFEANMRGAFDGKDAELDVEGLYGLTRLFCRIIDFRSRFTSTHTSGVAACATSLAGLAGFTETERRKMTLAGFIHDLGKLAIPPEILEKQSALSREEYEIIRTHAYHSDQILKPILAFDTVRKWGALHHERLDGSGYPYHLKARDLSTGSRIMSVADVFVALTEDRPYRKGMGRDDVSRVLDRMVRKSALDPRIVFLLGTRFHEINMVRISAQDEAAVEYRQFAGQAEDIARD